MMKAKLCWWDYQIMDPCSFDLKKQKKNKTPLVFSKEIECAACTLYYQNT